MGKLGTFLLLSGGALAALWLVVPAVLDAFKPSDASKPMDKNMALVLSALAIGATIWLAMIVF